MHRLESEDWRLRRVKGSHRQFRHPGKRMVITVPGQLGKDVPAGTLRAILRSAGLEKTEEAK
ncbi:MAG: type II toxin-antitoxin system HicA family toxin [Bryobacteraceae bacterium]